MSHNVKVPRSIFLVAAVTTFTVAPINAQTSDTIGWRWGRTGNVFAGLNYQHRRLADLRTIESQNWFMGQGERPMGRGQLSIHTMVSLEPFTLKEIGSPQVFQTGESFNGSPLVDYQHPHDLFAERLVCATRWTVDSQNVGCDRRRTCARTTGVHAVPGAPSCQAHESTNRTR